MLEGFENKDFVGQMAVLTQLGQEKKKESIADLFDLFLKSTGDKTTDTMIEHTLRDILVAHQEETVRRLANATHPTEKKLCLQVIRIEKFQNAVDTLIDMVHKETDMDVLTAVFLAMSEIKAPEFLELFRAHINHSNELIAAVCIEMIGKYHDTSTFSQLENTISEAEDDQHYQTCTVNTAGAIETLAAEHNERSVRFLTSKIHHRNPTARRIIQEELIKLGEMVLPYIEELFAQDNQDKKIMAANVAGRIGHKKGADIMVRALDKGQVDEINVKIAIYEAFGQIPSIKGLVCLADALNENEPQVLITAITSLDGQLNPGIVNAMKKKIHNNPLRGDQLCEALISAHAVNLFETLYHDNDIHSLLIKALTATNDPATLEIFRSKLEMIPGIQSAADRQTLKKTEITSQEKHVLAVDDSRPVLLFYRKIISSMDLKVTTAENGVNGLEAIEAHGPFDLIVTDMNMPYMDGIEFARHLRMLPEYTDTPIIMGTTESDQSQIDLATQSGINDFVTKPIKPEGLKEKIKQYL